MATPAAERQSTANHRPAPETKGVTGGRCVGDIELTPHYSTKEVPGRCVKCLAEGEYDSCLKSLLRGEDCYGLKETYEALVSFLKSPESRRLRDESERLLADGKHVTVRISYEDSKPKYELEVNE
jgi:hypothetical protein